MSDENTAPRLARAFEGILVYLGLGTITFSFVYAFAFFYLALS